MSADTIGPEVEPVAPRALRVRHRAEGLAVTLPPLLVAAERVAATVARGGHGRRRVGSGETFWQFRRYQSGDSAAQIDWRQSGKSDPLFVRETEWEAAQTVWLWADRSASMAYPTDGSRPTKRDQAEILLLALAVLLIRGGERVALLHPGSRPESGKLMLNRLAEALTAPVPIEDRTRGLPEPMPLPRYGRVVLIGDLLSPLDEIQATVARFSGQGVRGHLLQVLDPAEETLPFSGRVAFTGPEGEAPLLVPRVEAIRAGYLERLARQRAGLAAIARAAGWSFAGHRTDRPPQTALLALCNALDPATG
ncbi:MAG: DUF58 domain-containing protein [Rhodospirillaceae bacterium]